MFWNKRILLVFDSLLEALSDMPESVVGVLEFFEELLEVVDIAPFSILEKVGAHAHEPLKCFRGNSLEELSFLPKKYIYYGCSRYIMIVVLRCSKKGGATSSVDFVASTVLAVFEGIVSICSSI